MNTWNFEHARAWYDAQPWRVGCNFLPSTAINQLEMFQEDTYDPETIDRELGWAEQIGFTTLRVYLHDLVWSEDQKGCTERIHDFLAIAARHGMVITCVLFDDCHRPDPRPGIQPLPVYGVHNSGWMQSPGKTRVMQYHDGTISHREKMRLENYVTGVISTFAHDERILLWDIYNEAGQNGYEDASYPLLRSAWQWAQSVRPSQPLTACIDGTVGEKNRAFNAEMSDVITFHCYDGATLEACIQQHQNMYNGRPAICTEYMAREYGTTFQHSLPLFKRYGVSCYNWGLVAGKSQTHFNWKSIEKLEERRHAKAFVHHLDDIPEPPLWFHDIFRRDGTPYDSEETACIRRITRADVA